MVAPTIMGRVAIVSLDRDCRCLNCLASLGSGMLTWDLLIVVTQREATQLPPLIQKAAIVVQACESSKLTAARVARAINDLTLRQDPESDDLVHPDDLIPHVNRLFAQQVGHG